MESLAQLLSQNPGLIGHPAVYFQVSRLRWLRRIPDEGEDGFLPDVDYCPPAGTRQAARDSLFALVEAWVQGVLGQGWTLRPPKKRSGRKRTFEDISWDSYLLSRYGDVLAQFKQHSVKQAKAESKRQWLDRLCEIIQHVWTESGVGVEYESGDAPHGGGLLDAPIMKMTIPLPAERIRKWATRAIEVSAEGPIRDRLAYQMIGYRWKLRPHQVRGRIQAARKEEKLTEE